MRHCRLDYEAIQPWPTKRPHIIRDPIVGVVEVEAISIDERALTPIIPEDEPVFLIRAQDAAGPATVRAWADFAESHGASQEMVARVRAWSDEMLDYAASHGGMKTPDVPSGLLRS